MTEIIGIFRIHKWIKQQDQPKIIKGTLRTKTLLHFILIVI